jgi:hypothetical protein
MQNRLYLEAVEAYWVIIYRDHGRRVQLFQGLTDTTVSKNCFFGNFSKVEEFLVTQLNSPQK